MRTIKFQTLAFVNIILAILLTIFYIYFLIFEFPKYIKGIEIERNKPAKTDSINYQIKVRDSIIYDLYQENKRLKNNLKY